MAMQTKQTPTLMESQSEKMLNDVVLTPIDDSRAIYATRDVRELVKFRGKRAIIVTHVRDPVEAKQLRQNADFIVYEITNRTSEKELRRIIDNKLCDMLLGAEQLSVRASLHNQRIFFNHIIARICAEKKITVVLDLHQFFVGTLNNVVAQRLRHIILLCQKHKVSHIGATFANAPLLTRDPRDLACLVSVIAQSLTFLIPPKSTQTI